VDNFKEFFPYDIFGVDALYCFLTVHYPSFVGGHHETFVSLLAWVIDLASAAFFGA
jgi:hypothetical protein